MLEQREPLTKSEAAQINAVALAFVGDTVYSLYVRERLALSGCGKVAQLQKVAAQVVSAKERISGQAVAAVHRGGGGDLPPRQELQKGQQEQERKRARIQPFDGVRGGAGVLVPDGTGGAHSRTFKFKRRGKFRTHAGKNTLQTGEGRNAVIELLKTDKNIDKILLEKGAQGSLGLIFAQARKKNIRVQFVDKQVLEKESETKRHQGVIAFTTDYEYYDLDEIIENKKSEKGGFIVLCDGIEDVHNLGSILRVSECAGVDGVVITKSGCASVTESVIRISAGAAEHMKVAKVANLNQAVEKLQKSGYWVYALEAGGEDIYKENFSGNVALIVGGEDSGVKRLTKDKCDKVLSIPLQGKVNSLNASVALGIATYEVVRNRLKD